MFFFLSIVVKTTPINDPRKRKKKTKIWFSGQWSSHCCPEYPFTLGSSAQALGLHSRQSWRQQRLGQRPGPDPPGDAASPAPAFRALAVGSWPHTCWGLSHSDSSLTFSVEASRHSALLPSGVGLPRSLHGWALPPHLWVEGEALDMVTVSGSQMWHH